MIEYRNQLCDEGFTLVELLVVVTIIGILIAIAVPIYNNAARNANQAVHDANVRTLISAAQIYMCKEWDETIKDADTMKAILTDHLSGGVYPENPTNSGAYVVTIDDQGKINVSPGIGEY